MVKEKNKIIGYTKGVFDLFHIGHLNILKAAKSMCDELIVGVTTDELAITRKNKKPVIEFSERIEIIRSLRYVDRAIPQEKMDELSDWHNLHFNKLFVGDDWKGTDRWIHLERDLSNYNVEIVYLPYTQKTSSTKLTKVIEIMLETASGAAI